MSGLVKKTVRKLYNFAIDAVRLFIRLAHKAASALSLRDVVLFSSIPDFSESSAEVFKQMLLTEEFKGYKFIWFCNEPDKFRDKKSSDVIIKKRVDNPLFRLINLYTESTARYCVYTHEMIGNMYSQKQIRVYIEHGSFGIKRLKLEGRHNHTDYCTYRIQTSPNSLTAARSLGLPRNDRLFDGPEASFKKLSITGYDKVIIWMPTFKHYQFKSKFHMERNDYAIQKEYDITLQEDEHFYDKVDKALNDNNVLMIIKYHPSQDMRYVVAKETPNIRIIPDDELAKHGIPLYSLLGAADALVTDFSSVCYDYMLVDKPIGFDITDLDLYIKGGSSWASNPLDYMPGEKISCADDFCRFVKSVADGEDNFRTPRNELRDKIHVYHDSQSAKRVVDLMLGRLK